MRILITGATGFIGQHLLNEIKGDGHNVAIVSRNTQPRFWCSNTDFKLFCADISDKSSLEEAFKGGIDIVVNLAAELKNTNNLIPTNIQGVKNLIELSEKYKVNQIIHLSSVGVVGAQYSFKKTEVDEHTTCMPKNDYERTKLESEKLLNRIADEGKIKVVILRPTNVFGDHHPRLALLNLFKSVKNKQILPFCKNAAVNYVYVGDIVHAIKYCITNKMDNRVINIGEPQLLQDFLRLVAAQLSVKCKLFKIPFVLFFVMDKLNYLGLKSIGTKFRTVSNFVEYKGQFMKEKIGYKYGLELGLQKTIEFYTSQKVL